MKRLALFILTAAWASLMLYAQKPDTVVVPDEPFDLIGEGTRGVYGGDDRVDVTEVEGYDELVKATFVLVNKSSIHGNRIYTSTLRQNLKRRFGVDNFDPNVKFLDQPTAGTCTGFLIAPDILVTAGHCITEIRNSCEDYVWVADYTNELYYSNTGGYVTIDPNNVYQCDEVVDHIFTQQPWNDYAFIRLDRKSDRNPYKFRVSKSIKKYQDVFMIGAPTGLPLKLADNAYVTSTANTYTFSTKIDGFPGNSGGPDFDKNGWIEGIMVAGTDLDLGNDEWSGDYYYDAKCNCVKTVTFGSYGYENEFVQRITVTNYDLLVQAIYENLEYAILQNNNERLDEWMVYTGMMEHPYTVERGRLEFLAASTGNRYALQKYLKRSSNVNVKDEMGRNLLYQAIKRNDLAMLELLVAEGVNPNAEDKLGETPLSWAIDHDNLSMIEAVLKAGGQAKINALIHGSSALHRAVVLENMEMVQLLVEYGADIDAKNDRGWTSVKLARKVKARKIKRWLKKKRRELK